MTPKEKLYHYTDINALLGILRRDKIVLRATSCEYLNDYNEIKEGRESLVKVLGKDPTEQLSPRRFFITSFSKNNDSLPMWGMYGSNGNGCALVFHAEDLQKVFTDFSICTYGQEELQKEANLINNFSKSIGNENNGTNITTEQLQDNILYNLCLRHIVSAKNKAFQHEDEVRGVYRKSLWDEDDIAKIQFRYRDCVLIPFIEIELPKTAFKGIVFGPMANSERIQQSVLNYLSEFGYGWGDGYEVFQSNIPYIS